MAVTQMIGTADTLALVQKALFATVTKSKLNVPWIVFAMSIANVPKDVRRLFRKVVTKLLLWSANCTVMSPLVTAGPNALLPLKRTEKLATRPVTMTGTLEPSIVPSIAIWFAVKAKKDAISMTV